MAPHVYDSEAKNPILDGYDSIYTVGCDNMLKFRNIDWVLIAALDPFTTHCCHHLHTSTWYG